MAQTMLGVHRVSPEASWWRRPAILDSCQGDMRRPAGPARHRRRSRVQGRRGSWGCGCGGPKAPASYHARFA